MSIYEYYVASDPPSLPGFSFDYALGTAPFTPPPGIPEASTWVMVLAGFAGLGFAGYRVRARTALPA
jgi:hypothetical protein